MAREFFLLFFCSLFAFTSRAQKPLFALDEVQQIEIFFPFTNWDFKLDSVKYSDDGYLQADSVRINGTLFKKVGIKFKGNSSYDSSAKKNPFTISLDEYENQNYQGSTKLKLSNCFRDPSMVREVLSYYILRYYMHASQCNFAKLFVNGVYIGVYSNVEEVSQEFCSEKFASAKSNTFFKCNPIVSPGPSVKSNLKYLGPDTASYLSNYEMQSYEGWKDLVNLCDVITNNQNQLASNLDMDRVIWMLAFNSVMVNLDSYSGAFAQNYFMFKDNNGIFNPIVWDLNMSFGGFPFAGASNTSLGSLSITNMKQMPIGLHATDPYWPLINGVFGNAQYKKMLVAHMRTMVEDFFSDSTYILLALEMQNFARPAVTADSNRFYSLNDFNEGLTRDVSVGSYSVPGIQNLMSSRAAYLKTTPEFQSAPPSISNIACNYSVNDKIALVKATVSGATTVWMGNRINPAKKFNRILMHDDGNHNDAAAGDGIFGASFTADLLLSQYYIYAENNDAGAFMPRRAEHEFFSVNSPVFVNSAEEATFTIFPNPTHLFLNIYFNYPGRQTVTISDMLGKVLFNTVAENCLQINTTELPAGIYFIAIGNGFRKFIKQ